MRQTAGISIAPRWATAKIFAAVVALLLAGCGGQTGNNPPTHNHAADPHDDHRDHPTTHGHSPQHEGHLVELGNHVAMLEFKLDPATGTLILWALDGHAENHVRLAHESITLAILPEGASEPVTLIMAAQAKPETTGETVGNTSQFQGQSDALKNVRKFTGTIEKITVRGVDFAGVKFPYPEGRMHQYGHED